MSKYKANSSLPVNFEGFLNARVPDDVFVFYDDFMGCSWAIDLESESGTATYTGHRWLYTDVGVSAATALSLVDATYTAKSTLGGILRITTTATADGGANLQVNGTPFLIDEDCGLPLVFKTRFRTADVSNADIAIGLSAVDAEIITTGADDFVGFLLESGTLYTHCAESSKEYSVDTGITEADGATTTDTGWIRAMFVFDGDNTVSFFVDSDDDGEYDFVNSVNVGTTLHYLPDDVTLTPTIEVITGTTVTAETADIDYVYCAQQRYHA